MNAPAPSALFSPRDRRALLWLCVAAICWRWLLAIRSPLPAAGACTDLWVAQQLAAGRFGAFTEVWWRPLWALCVAPAVAAGGSAFVAAQVLGCVLGGLAIWPTAVAAERLRQGAGIPAAVFVLAAALPSHGAAVGSALPLATLLVGLAVAAWARGRPRAAIALFAAVAAMGCERLGPGGAPGGFWIAAWNGLRDSWSLAFAAALLSVLPPRPRRIGAVWFAALAALAVAVAVDPTTARLPLWFPLVAVLGGVGLARLPTRLGELALAGFVVVAFLAGWQAAEPRDAIVERLLGEHLGTRLGPGQHVVADLPRVLFHAGQSPAPPATDDALLQAASAPSTAFVVLGGRVKVSPTVTSALSGRFVRYTVPSALRDLVVDRRITVFVLRE